jgi:arylsulfatase A-like enzyme
MNVIWIISDTFRRDYLGAYGNRAIHTPALDALAAKSVRFDRHYMASFPTMPARADFATGRFTGTYMDWSPLAEKEVTLPELLSKNGIYTGAVVDTPFYLRNGMNYDRGFQSFDEIPGQTMNPEIAKDVRALWRYESDRFAPRTFTNAMQWLERHYKDDFFLYIDTWDPHEAWDAPAYYTELYWPGYDGEIVRPLYGFWQQAPGYSEEKVKKALATYCGEVTMVDTWFGYFMRYVENMGLMDKTAIIFTTDHGYYFGEHGGLFGKMVFARDPKTGRNIRGVWSHSPFYEEVTAIPLIIYLPKAKPAVYHGLTSAIDLMPTVMDILGQAIPSSVEGHSLLPAVKDPSFPGRDYVVSAHPFINAGDALRSVDDIARVTEKASTATVTTKEWSLLYNVDPGLSELYRLSLDPKQEKNVISEHADVAFELHKLLLDFMHRTKLAKRLLEPRLQLRM